ncbi:MAG: stage II sporulation protein M [Candidatus Woesearchaeota archaeon]
MSFELLLQPFKAQRKPYVMILFAFLVSSIAIILSLRIFPRCSSLLIVTFSIIPLIPIMVKLIEIEESRLEKAKRWYRLKNYSIIRIYALLFIGFIISFSLWYTFLPSEKSEELFREQIHSLEMEEDLEPMCDSGILSRYIDEYSIKDCKIRDYGDDGRLEYLVYVENKSEPLIFIPETEEFHERRAFMQKHYFTHNFQLLFFIFLTSFIFGSGALFILVWNASIIGVYIGEIANRGMHLITSPFGKIAVYFKTLPVSLGGLLLHGIFEVTGFFIAALAGGILSVVLIKHNIRDKHVLKIFLDSVLLFGIATILIFIGAFIESW